MSTVECQQYCSNIIAATLLRQQYCSDYGSVAIVGMSCKWQGQSVQQCE